MQPTEDPLIGRTIRGTIRIVRRIGEGGMGFVYEAYQEHLERRLAVKVMTPEHARNPVAADYFLREARSVAKLRHPNIIQIIDFGKDGDETLFLAMEFVPGELLTDTLFKEHPLPKARVVNILEQTLSGLEEAHAHSIIHRDLKPDNIMIETTRTGRTHVKILDFGIAHLRDTDSSNVGVLTQQGAILGTPQYMSPEQARGERVDHRADLFSIGTILYELLTNTLPFQGDNVPAILMRVINKHPAPPSAIRRDIEIDPALEAICLRALHKDPALRYQSAREFKVALKETLLKEKKKLQRTEPAAQFIFKRSKSTRTKRPSSLDPATKLHARTPFDRRDTEDGFDPSTRREGSRKEKIESFMPVVDTNPDYPGLDALSEALVVNVNDLFGTLDGPPSHVEEILDAHLEDPPVARRPPSDFSQTAIGQDAWAKEQPAPKSQPKTSRFGLNLDELRGDLLGEKRHVQVVVLHQRPPATFDAEALSELHERLSHVIGALSPQYGAQVHSRQGGYVTFLLGFDEPDARGHVDAARFAIVLRDTLSGLSSTSPTPPRFGVAITQGEVFAPGQQLERADGLAISEATEIARRAPQDTILVGGDVLQMRLDVGFDLGDPERDGERMLHALKPSSKDRGDFAERPNSDVFASSESLAPGEALLVGREIQIAGLLRHLGRLMRGEGGSLCLLGEGGSGKSALLRRLGRLARERDVTILPARVLFRGALGVRDLLRQWTLAALTTLDIPYTPAGALDDLLSDPVDLTEALKGRGLSTECARLLDGLMREDLAEVVGFRGDARVAEPEANMAFALEAALRQLILLLARDQGVVVVLDEIDALDEPLHTLCQRLMGFLEQAPVLCCVALRSTLVDAPGAAQFVEQMLSTSDLIELHRLDDSSSAVLLRALIQPHVDTPMTKEMVSRLAKISVGNPLQIATIAKIFANDPAQRLDELEAALARSDDVSELMRLRMRSLSAHAKNMLALIAVLGDGSEADTIVELASKSWQPEETLEALYEAQLVSIELHPHGARVFFSPPALRLVVYQSLSKKNRLRVHDRAAVYLHQKLVTRGELEPQERRQLAHHFDALGRHELALRQYRTLYDQAFASFQYEEARELLAKVEGCASHLPGDTSKSTRYRLERVQLLAVTNQERQAIEQAVALDRDTSIGPPLSYDIKLTLAKLWLDHEDPAMVGGMLTHLAATLAEAIKATPAITWMLVRAHTLLGATSEKQGQLVQAIGHLIDAIDLLDSHEELLQAPSSDTNPIGPALLWEPFNQLGRVRLKNREPHGAEEMLALALDQARAHEDRIGEMVVRGNLATLHSMRGDGERALAEIDTALEAARHAGQLIAIAKLLFNQGLVHLRMEQPEGAKASFTESEALCRDLDWREGLAMTLHHLRALDA